MTWTSPRTKGMWEQYTRARHFIKVAKRCKKPETRFRYLIAAVYPARAITELILQSAESQELTAFKNKNIKQSYKDCEIKLAPRLPYYYLIEKIRLHDFHRFGCLPPSKESQSVFYGGPMKYYARKGIAAIAITSDGPKSTTSGSSLIKEQRSLCSSDGRFFDDETGKYIELDLLLKEYLDAVFKVLTEFNTDWAG